MTGQVTKPLSLDDQAVPAVVNVGLVGRGIQKSRTPAMHEAEGAAHGMAYTYRLFDMDAIAAESAKLPAILDHAEQGGFAGLNVTYPFKVEVIDLLDELSEGARAVGAVNTVVFRDGRRIGHNTDYSGFAESFRLNMAGEARAQVLQIGAGGAGAAVANALLSCDVELLEVFDIDAAKAQGLVDSLVAKYGAGRARVVSAPADHAKDLDGIVNTSPVGMASLPGCPFPPEQLRADMWVADIIYFPLETELLRQAKLAGCRTLAGTGMAVFQAVRAFEHFTGQRADPERMRATFDAFDSSPRETAIS